MRLMRRLCRCASFAPWRLRACDAAMCEEPEKHSAALRDLRDLRGSIVPHGVECDALSQVAVSMGIEAALESVEEDGSALIGFEIEGPLKDRPRRGEKKKGRCEIEEERPARG